MLRGALLCSALLGCVTPPNDSAVYLQRETFFVLTQLHPGSNRESLDHTCCAVL